MTERPKTDTGAATDEQMLECVKSIDQTIHCMNLVTQERFARSTKVATALLSDWKRRVIEVHVKMKSTAPLNEAELRDAIADFEKRVRYTRG